MVKSYLLGLTYISYTANLVGYVASTLLSCVVLWNWYKSGICLHLEYFYLVFDLALSSALCCLQQAES